jgi:beta-lactam-binding protein with PASTA domain
VTLAVPWVIVGQYEGLQLDDARQQIRSIDLTESVSYRPTTDYRVGTVLSQSPSAGSRAKHRSQVFLTVASTPPTPPPPPPPTGMPPVIGMKWEDAKRLLEQEFGLTVVTACWEIPKGIRNPPAAGTVAAQTPTAGSSIANKPVVTLQVASPGCIQ